MRFQKNTYICSVIKKTIIMESNYRITVIFDRDVIREKFATKEDAKNAIVVLKNCSQTNI